jgi:hypothetical protein
MADPRPRFLIIGAVKAATTWLSQQLRAHPMLWLPDAEPHYFSTEYHRGADWYAGLFAEAPAGRIVGEKSADYLAHPLAAERIARTLPAVPMVAQLRNPVDRAYSDYCMLFRRGMVGPDPRRYLDRVQAGESRFLVNGCYASHLRRFRRHCPDAPLKVLLYEDVRDRPREVIAEVCVHLGVPVHIGEPAVATRSNDSRAPMLPLSLRRLLAPVRPILDPLRANAMLARARQSLARPVRYPPLTEELRAMLQAYYRDDVNELSAMLQRDLTCWSDNAARPAAADHPMLMNQGDRA